MKKRSDVLQSFELYVFFLQGYRGRRKHLKRLVAPKTWMLDKLGGVFVSTILYIQV